MTEETQKVEMSSGVKTSSWIVATAVAAVPLCVLAWAIGGTSWLVGAVVGAAVAIANSWLVATLTERLLEKVHADRPAWATALAFVLKTSLLLLLVYVVLMRFAMSPMGFAIGITSFAVGFVTFGLYFRRSKEESYASR